MAISISKITEKFKEKGAINFISLICARFFSLIKKGLYYLYWLYYRFRNKSNQKNPIPRYLNQSELETLKNKEETVREIIQKFGKQSFLEIGVGNYPILDRLKLISDMNFEYVGCDFDRVCHAHMKMITNSKLNYSNITFIGNSQGTYAWTLFELMQRGKKFDLIFLDGHHTFYVDLPAFYLANELLAPGGYILVDDIRWNLQFLKDNFLRSFNEWFFYHSIYDFSQYTADQQVVNHIELIVNEILIRKYKYIKLDKYSSDEWLLLQKPN